MGNVFSLNEGYPVEAYVLFICGLFKDDLSSSSYDVK
jgi:hypothetical protein